MEEVIIGAIAAVLTAIGIGTAWLQSRKQAQASYAALELELKRERDRTHAAGRADLIAQITRGPIQPEKLLVVTNRGSGRASYVHVRIDGVPIREHELFKLVPNQDPPMTEVAAADRITFRILPHGQSAPTVLVDLDWKSENGDPGHYGNRLHT